MRPWRCRARWCAPWRCRGSSAGSCWRQWSWRRPSLREAALRGDRAFPWVLGKALPGWPALVLFVCLGTAQYLCGLATVTSASRMMYAFARDGGLPFSETLRRVSPTLRTPVWSVWTVAGLSVAFTVYAGLYTVISSCAAILLFISYALPTILGIVSYRRTWTRMGPWDLGMWYRPLGLICVLGTGLLFVIGIQPPNEKVGPTIGGLALVLLLLWFGRERRRFKGPPRLHPE